MRSGLPIVYAMLASGLALAQPFPLLAQQPGPSTTISTEAPVIALPEAPKPKVEIATLDLLDQQAPSPQNPATPQPAPKSTPAQTPATQGSSGSQPPAGQTAEESERQKAAEQLKQQEQQRVFGIMATFNTTRNPDALPLSGKQKYQLFFKGATDPWAFSLSSIVASIGQARNDEPEWGQGMKGYSIRFGAAYSDYFIGNFFGNAVLPAMLHEDPRYFQKGSGPVFNRVVWAAGSTVWCKRDKGGWGPNYANVMGNLIGTAIARVYYPSAERTVSSTLTDGFTVTAEGVIGSEVIEFWPDLVRHHRRKQAEKLARIAAKTDTRTAAQAPLNDEAAKQVRQDQKPN